MSRHKKIKSQFHEALALTDPVGAAQAAAILGCSRSTYYRRADIPKIFVDGQVCTPRSALATVQIRGRA